jgi:hypothetical protein
MKKSALHMLLFLAACSPGNKETNSQDSTAMNDTLDVPAIADNELVDEVVKEMSDTSQLEITFDETAGLVFERQELFYTVSVTTSMYESSSDVTWYFDLDFSPIYFKETWASEGNEGSTELFIQDGNVACAYTEEYSTVNKWCRVTGGTRTTSNDKSAAENIELLPSEHGADVNEELTRYLGILKAILAEAEVRQEDENLLTLRIEKMIQIGEEEFPGSTEVSIPKKLYEAIK